MRCIAADATYAPNEFIGPDGKAVTGSAQTTRAYRANAATSYPRLIITCLSSV